MAKKDIDPPAWPLPEQPGFAAWSKGLLAMSSKSRKSHADGLELFEQQRFCRRYLGHDGPHRGLILYHGLGSGKSCSAIATAEALRAAAGRTVFVMLSASLRGNYIREMRLCGGKAFRENQAWAYDKTVDRWEPDSESHAGTPFDALSAAERDAIRAQVDAEIARTHRFVHYNGLTPAVLNDLTGGDANPFDDAVVVIDEAHNFVSNLAGGKLAAALYRRIYEARRCKVLLLSGTPLVNEPEELAYLANLVHGPVRTYEIERVGMEKRELSADDAAKLRANPYVLEFSETLQVDAGRGRVARILTLSLTEEGFVKTDEKGASVIRGPGPESDHALEAQLASVKTALGLPLSTAVRTREKELLPSDPEAFRAAFVEEVETKGVTEERLKPSAIPVLEKSLVGLVSYFRGHDPSLYPSLRNVKLVFEPLSPRQFSEYTTVRVAERRREDAARRFAAANKGAVSSDGVGMRPFSRAACTFVFPEGIVRPRKGRVPDADDADAETKSKSATYDAALDRAIDALRALPPAVLAIKNEGGQLAELSPKFDSIVRRLLDQRKKNEGTSIVYSQFKRAEGVAILAVAMEANGFVQFAIERASSSQQTKPKRKQNHKHELECVLKLGGKRLTASELTPEVLARPRYILYSNDDRDVAEATKDVFNDKANDAPESVRATLEKLNGKKTNPGNLRGETVAVMLITRSGAEGISTRNVRQVHVVEPFWHANRVLQVIGRARRAHSHDDLPATERNVDVFVYVSTFTESQAALHKADKGMTSDEYVHDVAQRKRKLLAGLLEVMQKASVGGGDQS